MKSLTDWEVGSTMIGLAWLFGIIVEKTLDDSRSTSLAMILGCLVGAWICYRKHLRLKKENQEMLDEPPILLSERIKMYAELDESASTIDTEKILEWAEEVEILEEKTNAPT